MNKDDILRKSRAENKDRDLHANEIQIYAGHVGSLVSLALATLFFIIQAIVGRGFNFGLYAIVVSVGAAGFAFKAFSRRRKRDIVLCMLYTLVTLALSVVHIYQLVAAAGPV